MKERPILFNGAMVRAILDGRKTQTRRVVKWKPIEAGLNVNASSLSLGHYHTGLPSSGHVLYSRGGSCWNQVTHPIHSPYGQPGDRLWVRETWAMNHYVHGFKKAPKDRPAWLDLKADDPWLVYRADGSWEDQFPTIDGNCPPWRPSIHIPRWASRITLEVTGVRVERLQEISEEDALAEGIHKTPDPDMAGCAFLSRSDPKKGIGWRFGNARAAFADLWDSLAKPGVNWAANPWVWVVEFKRVTP